MAYEATSGLQVVNHYGARETGGSVGVEHSSSSRHVLSFELTGTSLADGTLSAYVLPKGAKITKAVIAVDEVFSGVTSVSLGEGNAAATNGITLNAAALAKGVRDVTASLTGEWAGTAGAATTKAAQIGIVVTGTPSPLQGLATVTVEFVYKRRDDSEYAVAPGTLPTYPAQR